MVAISKMIQVLKHNSMQDEMLDALRCRKHSNCAFSVHSLAGAENHRSRVELQGEPLPVGIHALVIQRHGIQQECKNREH